MSPKWHPILMSRGHRKALKKVRVARGMTRILADQAAEMRTRGEALLRQADKLSCESWNERMWADGEPIDPSPTIDQAINGGYPWLQIGGAHRAGRSQLRRDHQQIAQCARRRGAYRSRRRGEARCQTT